MNLLSFQILMMRVAFKYRETVFLYRGVNHPNPTEHRCVNNTASVSGWLKRNPRKQSGVCAGCSYAGISRASLPAPAVVTVKQRVMSVR